MHHCIAGLYGGGWMGIANYFHNILFLFTCVEKMGIWGRGCPANALVIGAWQLDLKSNGPSSCSLIVECFDDTYCCTGADFS